MHFLVPKIANYSADIFPNIAYIKYLVFIYLYVTAIPFTLLFIKRSNF